MLLSHWIKMIFFTIL